MKFMHRLRTEILVRNLRFQLGGSLENSLKFMHQLRMEVPLRSWGFQNSFDFLLNFWFSPIIPHWCTLAYYLLRIRIWGLTFINCAVVIINCIITVINVSIRANCFVL